MAKKNNFPKELGTNDILVNGQLHVADNLVLGNPGLSDYTVIKADGSGALLVSTNGGSETSLGAPLTISSVTGLQAALDSKADLVGGKIVTSQLPALSITSVNVVANQAAQLALTAQEGDVAVRSDTNTSYVHNGGSAGTMADWTLLATPTDNVLSVAGKTGAVTLAISDITSLQTSLNTLNVYDIPGGSEGTTASSEVLVRFVAPRAFTIPAGATGSTGHAGVTATVSSAVFNLAKNGSNFGTMTFGVGSSTPTFSVASSTSFAAGDRLTVTAPASANAALAQFSFTLVGTLS